jgi:hypothetical protein
MNQANEVVVIDGREHTMSQAYEGVVGSDALAVNYAARLVLNAANAYARPAYAVLREGEVQVGLESDFARADWPRVVCKALPGATKVTWLKPRPHAFAQQDYLNGYGAALRVVDALIGETLSRPRSPHLAPPAQAVLLTLRDSIRGHEASNHRTYESVVRQYQDVAPGGPADLATVLAVVAEQTAKGVGLG